jgi:hypothetical protein
MIYGGDLLHSGTYGASGGGPAWQGMAIAIPYFLINTLHIYLSTLSFLYFNG